MSKRIMRPKQIWTALGIGKVKYWADVKAGNLPKPKPITPGSRAVGTPAEVIDALIERQMGQAA